VGDRWRAGLAMRIPLAENFRVPRAAFLIIDGNPMPAITTVGGTWGDVSGRGRLRRRTREQTLMQGLFRRTAAGPAPRVGRMACTRRVCRSACGHCGSDRWAKRVNPVDDFWGLCRQPLRAAQGLDGQIGVRPSSRCRASSGMERRRLRLICHRFWGALTIRSRRHFGMHG